MNILPFIFSIYPKVNTSVALKYVDNSFSSMTRGKHKNTNVGITKTHRGNELQINILYSQLEFINAKQ